MLKKIKLNCGANGWARQWAWVDGNFALHPSIVWSWKSGARCWAVTHIPSGTAVFDALDNKTMALEALRQAQRMRWRGLDPFSDLPVCELLNVAPMIMVDYYGNDKWANEWQEKYQQEIADALECAPAPAEEA